MMKLKNMSLRLRINRYGISNLPPPNKRSKVEELEGSADLNEEGDCLESLCLEETTEDSADYRVTDDFSNTNSRENGRDVGILEAEEAKEAACFEQDELTCRQSVLIFTNKKSTQKVLSLESFKILTVLGKGTFGKVYLTELLENKKLYAIKAIRKDVLLETEQIENTKLERDILLECDHPFL